MKIVNRRLIAYGLFCLEMTIKHSKENKLIAIFILEPLCLNCKKYYLKFNQMKNLLFLFLFVLSFNHFSIAQMQKEESLLKTVDKFRLLLLDPVKTELDQLCHANLTYGHSNGKIENKSEFIEAYVSGNSDFIKVTFSDIKLFITGKTAIVRHTLEAEAKDGDKPAGNIKIKVMLIFQLEKSEWKLIGRQAVKI